MHLDHDGDAFTPCYDFICRACSSPLVQAVKWVRVDRRHWSVTVRCPECHKSDELLLDEDRAHDFLLEAEQAVGSLRELADALDREIFRNTCEDFCRALRAGHISPMDF
jgi:hypothetical protein